jgi:predicted Co/Zn/Cd cation transporter (cation efflux family)
LPTPNPEYFSREELIETIQLFSTQQQQMIDILMMILKNHNSQDLELVDHVHNERHQFLSDLSEEELTVIQQRLGHR